MPSIKIACRAADAIDLDQLLAIQGSLKTLSPENAGKLKKQIIESGFRAPIFVWDKPTKKDGKQTYKILDGHQRLTVLTQLRDEGYTIPKLPVAFIEAKDEKDAYKAVLQLSSQFGEMTNDGITAFLETAGLDLSALEEFRFPDLDLDALFPKTEVTEDAFDADAAAASIKDPITKLGDLYIMGRHRLYCGDATKQEDVDKLMDGKKADMVFTDPPYNIAFSGSMSNTTVGGQLVKHKGANTKHDAIENDSMTDEEFHDLLIAALQNIKRVVSGAWYITFGSQTLDQLLIPLRELGMNWKSIIIWMKNQSTLSGKDYKSRYEPIAYGRFNDDFHAQRYEQEDIWQFQRTLSNDLHPTMKPIPLVANAITNSSLAGQTVLDLFGGSGSTLIACEETGREARVLELAPLYCDVIVRRWEELTGQKAERIPA